MSTDPFGQPLPGDDAEPSAAEPRPDAAAPGPEAVPQQPAYAPPPPAFTPPPAAYTSPAPPPYTGLPNSNQYRTVGDSQATVALVCALVGLLICPLLGIIPVIQGQSARKESRLTGMPMNGTLKAAWIIGIIELVLVVVWLVVVAIIIALASTGNVDWNTITTTTTNDGLGTY